MNFNQAIIEQTRAMFLKTGFVIVDNFFSAEEVNDMLLGILNYSRQATDETNENLFAIRRFLNEVPEIQPHIFRGIFIDFITAVFGKGFFPIKSIYFDKPPSSNWFVAYHRDLSISVDKKIVADGFKNWTIKEYFFSVQPPMEILQDNFTIRIHLDNTDENNGALKVVPGSHLSKAGMEEEEIICSIKKGGIMLMSPLLLHASGRTVNNKRRRVIHIEFGRSGLPENLHWSEKITIPVSPSVF